jgi:lipopolysaccharide export LptBFGC system permease protein LptF
MDLGIILAISIGCFTIAATTITMLLWLRSESRSDWRNLQDQIIEDRREFIAVVNEIKIENKDFHYRLLEIERNRFKVQS